MTGLLPQHAKRDLAPPFPSAIWFPDIGPEELAAETRWDTPDTQRTHRLEAWPAFLQRLLHPQSG